MKIEHMEPTKEQIACRQECPRFEWHVMLSLSKNHTFCLAVWGYHPDLKLYKDSIHYVIYENMIVS